MALAFKNSILKLLDRDIERTNERACFGLKNRGTFGEYGVGRDGAIS